MTYPWLPAANQNRESSVYSVRRCKLHDGMSALRQMFPDGIASELNFVLFSTSGVHGDYGTIEECESEPGCCMTFLIVQPRVVCLSYGNCAPDGKDDFDFLKKLRASSWDAVRKIGAPEPLSP